MWNDPKFKPHPLTPHPPILLRAVPPRFAGHEQRDIRLDLRPRLERDVESLERTDMAEEERHVAAFQAQGALRLVARRRRAAQLVHRQKRPHHPPPSRAAPGILGL